MKIVFVVDDCKTNLMAVKMALEGIYQTHAMISAASMFKLMEQITPNLALLDIDMPIRCPCKRTPES